MLQLTSVAEDAIRVEFEPSDDQMNNQHLIGWKHALTTQFTQFISDVVIGYTTLTIYFDPLQISHKEIKNKASDIFKHLPSYERSSRLLKIPVCYDKEFGMDLESLATYHNLTTDEVIERHSSPMYLVNFLGFSPGFPFLSGMDKSLATPRKTNPRKKIAAGSVAIAGEQTGIYPSSSPGGWNIIGRTNVELVTLSKKEPSLLLPGDQLQFYPISKADFERRKIKVEVISI